MNEKPLSDISDMNMNSFYTQVELGLTSMKYFKNISCKHKVCVVYSFMYFILNQTVNSLATEM